MEKETDTIVSQATAAGVGAVGIIRISGIESKKVLEDLYMGMGGEVGSGLRSRYMYHGKIIRMRDGRVLDEVLVVYMRGPKSFTGEDVVEIHCHGGELVPNKIMEEILNLGYVRLAYRGEFTRRAYLNGKVDLLQAEAIDEIIKARNEKLLESGQGILKRELSDKINGYRRMLLDVLSGIEAYIDYPEEELEGPFGIKIKKLLSEIRHDIEKVLKDSKEGERLRSGVRVVLVGRPNVGKSSLFNYLLRKNRSIVSSSPGTTRDYIESMLMLGGELEVELVDTAGVREDAEDVIEGEGIKFSYAKMGDTDYVLWLLDSSEGYSKDDDVIKQELERLGVEKEKVILVKNKIDLVKGVMDDGILKGFNTFSVSVLEGYGLKEFELGIKELILGRKEGVEINRDKIYCNIRQAGLLRGCCAGIKEVEKLLSKGAGYEFISLELMGALGSLDELVGEHTTSDRVIDNIFDKFCVGK